MKFLCVCEAGIVRSGALAYSLRYNFGQGQVFQASHSKTPQPDLDMMAAWADYIVVMEPKFANKFERFKEKVRILDVGPDIWMDPFHPELQSKVSEVAQTWSRSNWKF